MNNISFSKKFSGVQERKWVGINWHPTLFGDPREKDTYLVTIGNEGIENFTMVAEWNNTNWICEHLGNVLAYAKFPLPYIKGE